MEIRESFMEIRVEKSLPTQLDFLVAAKLIHLVLDIVFEALDVLYVGATIIIMLLLTSPALPCNVYSTIVDTRF